MLDELVQCADANDDGVLDYKEFLALLATAHILGLLPAVRARLIAPHLCSPEDHGQDGSALGEWHAFDLGRCRSQDSPLAELSAAFTIAIGAFRCFDHGHHGVIVFSELGEAMELSSAEELAERMKELDADGNGYVTYTEFMMAFCDWVGVMDDY